MSAGGEFGYGGERRQVTEVVTHHHHGPGAGFGDDPAHGVPLVTAHRRSQLPDHLPGDELQPLLLGDVPRGPVDRVGPAVPVGDTAGGGGGGGEPLLPPRAPAPPPRGGRPG